MYRVQVMLVVWAADTDAPAVLQWQFSLWGFVPSISGKRKKNKTKQNKSWIFWFYMTSVTLLIKTHQQLIGQILILMCVKLKHRSPIYGIVSPSTHRANPSPRCQETLFYGKDRWWRAACWSGWWCFGTESSRKSYSTEYIRGTTHHLWGWSVEQN